jgi:uncharacterized protein YbjT (DUF2867 family)
MPLTPLNPNSLVFVAGATGGVGQLTVATLIDQQIPVRAMVRPGPESRAKAECLFDQRAELVEADTQTPATLAVAMAGITHLICCTGTTAFPSERWGLTHPDGQPLSPLEKLRAFFDPQFRNQRATNGPYQVDYLGVQNLIAAAPSTLERFVLVSSLGINRQTQFPFTILNAFGVLAAKQKGEEALHASGLPYTIVRPGRLIDGPYTSYDLNTLLKATTQGKLGVVVGKGDTLQGDASRIDVARVCVEVLRVPATLNQTFELVNQGERPAAIAWSTLLEGLA